MALGGEGFSVSTAAADCAESGLRGADAEVATCLREVDERPHRVLLKIAKSSIDGVAGASGESALARAIIDLGESFQLRVMAEGIEQADKLERLRLGCELGQGYYFAKPMDAAALERLLAGHGPLPRSVAAGTLTAPTRG